MFCSNCGFKTLPRAKFCGNCGYEIISFRTEVEKEKTINLSQSIKREVSSLPLITLIGDSVKGASGLSILQEQLKHDPENPLLWMFYYEGYVTYKKMDKGVSAARLLYNPVGFAVSKSVSAGLNVMDDEYEKFDPQKCLAAALSLSMKKIESGSVEPIDLLITGKTLFYTGINKRDLELRSSILLRAVKYLTLAIQTEKNEKLVGEYFFYLAQVYEVAGNTRLQFRALNTSRKMGFMPSLELLKKLLKERGIKEEKLTEMVIAYPAEQSNQFKFTFRPEVTEKIENSLKFAITEQKSKIKETSTRVKKFFL